MQVPLVEGDYRVALGFSTDTHFEDRQGLAMLTVTPTARHVRACAVPGAVIAAWWSWTLDWGVRWQRHA